MTVKKTYSHKQTQRQMFPGNYSRGHGTRLVDSGFAVWILIPLSVCMLLGISIYEFVVGFSDAATDAKRSFVGVYPGMPHITSGLSLTADNGMSGGQSPRRVSFASDSDHR